MLYNNMGSKMTPSLISEGGPPSAPPSDLQNLDPLPRRVNNLETHLKHFFLPTSLYPTLSRNFHQYWPLSLNIQQYLTVSDLIIKYVIIPQVIYPFYQDPIILKLFVWPTYINTYIQTTRTSPRGAFAAKNMTIVPYSVFCKEIPAHVPWNEIPMSVCQYVHQSAS